MFKVARPGWNLAIFCGLILLLLVPVWSFRYVPTTDGPSHLYNALTLRDYARPGHEPIRTFFALNIRPFPNWIASVLLTGFCYLLPPFIAEKLFLSLYLVAFMLAARWALASINPEAAALAVGAAPFASSFYFHEGLYSFCLGLVMYFVVIGYWVRQERRHSAARTIILSLLLIILYFAHLIGLVMAGVLIALLIMVRLVRAQQEGADAIRAAWRSAARNALAILPAFLAAIYFVLTEHSDRFVALAKLHAHAWPYRVRNLLSWMKSFSSIELAPAALHAMLFAAIAIWFLRRRNWKFQRNDGFLLAVGVYLIMFLASPTAWGAITVLIRLACFPYFALLLWFASEPLQSAQRQRLDAIVAMVSTVVTVALMMSHLLSYARINPYLQEYADAESLVPSGATLLPIAYADGADVDQRGRRLSIGSSPLVMGGASFAAQRGIVSLDDYEADVDYFPLTYRPGFDPYVSIIDNGWNFADYRSPAGQHVDYLLLWTGGVDRQDAVAKYIHRQLAAHYELIFTSGYSRYARLYRLRTDKATPTSGGQGPWCRSDSGVRPGRGFDP